MAERSTITQVTQIGVEATAGTGVDADLLLQAVSIEPAIKANVSTFRPIGGKYTTIAALGKEWVEAKISAPVACYNHLAYLFSGILAYAAPAQQGATTAYKWTMTPSQTAEDTIKTFSVEQGSSVRAGKFYYGLINSLGISFDREKCEVSGTMLGQAYQDGITMTGTPSAIAVKPVLPTDLCIYLDTTGAGLGGTKLTRVLSGSLDISDRYSPLWAIDCAVDGFAAHVETPPTAQLKLLVEADAAGMGVLTPLRSGDKRFARLKWTSGDLAGTGYYYTLQIDLAGVVTDVGEFSDEDGVYAIEWTFDVAYDSTWTKALEVQLTNVLTDL